MPPPKKTANPEDLWTPVEDTSAWTPVDEPAVKPSPALVASNPDTIKPTPAPALGQRLRTGALDLLKGAGEGAVHTISSTDDWAIKHLPTWMTTPIGKAATVENQQKARAFTQELERPTNTTQHVGKVGEQIGEFFAPTGIEEGLAKAAGGLGKGIGLLGRVTGAGVHSGLVNSAQGGGFGSGFTGGAVGSGIGAGLGKIAPMVAESALNIRKLDRAFGKGGGKIGRAILDETSGFSPSAVAESAQSKLNELNPMLNDLADQASKTPNRIIGLLTSGKESVPLGEPPVPGDMPGGLFPAQRFPAQNVGEARIIRNPKGQILPKTDRLVEFPDENGLLPSARGYNGKFLSRQPTRSAFMTGIEGEIPETSSFSGPGVWLRQPEITGGPVPDMISNRTASLLPSKSVLSDAFGTASRQGERTTLGQINPLVNHISEDISGNPLGDSVTPRQLLDLKRGFGNEFIHRWNPETMTGVKGTAARTYRAMGDEFNRVVPGAKELNTRISSLIPVAKRAASEELNAPTTQKLFQRIAAPTGALTGALGGGVAGYKHGGASGAIEGAAAGILAPLLLASPTGQMAMARMLNGLSRPASKAVVGAGLQATARNKPKAASAPK